MKKTITDLDFNINPVEFNNPRIRYSARGIVINDEGKIALLCKKNINLYKLVGGGLNDNETPIEGFIREVKEEIGAEIGNIKYIGEIYEEKSLDNFIQVSYVYIANILKVGKPNFTFEEIIDGSYIEWVYPTLAKKLLTKSLNDVKPSKNDEPLSVYHSKFIVKRDLEILNNYISQCGE